MTIDATFNADFTISLNVNRFFCNVKHCNLKAKIYKTLGALDSSFHIPLIFAGAQTTNCIYVCMYVCMYVCCDVILVVANKIETIR